MRVSKAMLMATGGHEGGTVIIDMASLDVELTTDEAREFARSLTRLADHADIVEAGRHK